MFTVTNTMVNSTLVQLLIKKKRKQDHKDGTKSGSTKFQHAIKLHGFDNFKYKVLQTIQYSNICELWELEDTYIKKYNSIDNGYNYRFNRNKNCNI